MNYTGKTLTTAPAAEPVAITDNLLKASLRIDHTSDDTLLPLQVTAARETVETLTGRALITQTWTVYWESFPNGDTLELPFPPLQSVTHVKYYDVDDDVATFSNTLYDVDVTGLVGVVRLKDGESWPTTTLRPTKGVEVQFVAGYGATAASVPEQLKQLIVLLVAQAYDGYDPHRALAIQSLLMRLTVQY